MPSADVQRPSTDALYLTDVNCHDIWDHREAAVGNPEVWKAFCTSYKSSDNFKATIPHIIHQIWIGSRQPPCVWLDTWRVDFLSKFESPTEDSATQHGWEYKLWDNQAVKNMPMINRELFDAESAPQCQADILRLEVLYEYGGVYIDADIVSTVRDLRPALVSAQETGFLITYEPDTKDKPYSILGNSLIACTPRHPLILMLMSYIKQIYPHKRAHYGVEWVTGPLTYTKVLMHTSMPVTVPPSKDFYPAFHYIPNPSAVDVTRFDSYCFQFGYTCSGLSQWVAANNKCKQAHDCSYHARTEYPLGKLRQFPAEIVQDVLSDCDTIPKTIHQIAFQDEYARPNRWMKTWSDNFCPAYGFKYEVWTWQRLKDEIGSFYCANLYEEGRMDEYSIKMLALEILHHHGGYYIPLSTMYIGDGSDPEATERIFDVNGDQGAHHIGSIIGHAKNSCLKKIKDSYDSGHVSHAKVESRDVPRDLVNNMGFGDEITALTDFKDTSRFLGASEIHYIPYGKSVSSELSPAKGALLWAYDCQVPIFRYDSEKAGIDAVKQSGKRSIVITDPALGMYPSLVDEVPGVIYRLEQEGKDWDFIVLNVEWEVDEDGLAVYPASSPFRAPTAQYFGFVVNSHATKLVKSANIETILEQHRSGRVYVASEKSMHSAKLAAMYRAMPCISNVCQKLAGHEPNFYRDHDEVLDGLMKGFRHGQLGFEMQVDDQNRIMFRSWAYNGGIDCDCKVIPGMSGTTVEWLRVYRDHQVAHETVGKVIR